MRMGYSAPRCWGATATLLPPSQRSSKQGVRVWPHESFHHQSHPNHPNHRIACKTCRHSGHWEKRNGCALTGVGTMRPIAGSGSWGIGASSSNRGTGCLFGVLAALQSSTANACSAFGDERLSSHYNNIPKRLLTPIVEDLSTSPQKTSYCAGYELSAWRCNSLADHLMEWIVDYALSEDELSVHHGNLYIRLKEAAARIYTSAKYKQRGEVGEIALHAVCRDFFGTIPIAPRVFYLTASNDVVKSFDMVHVRYIEGKKPELWLGESKFYTDPKDAISAAIESISTHIDRGFLNNQKLLLGPQVSKSIPHYQERPSFDPDVHRRTL